MKKYEWKIPSAVDDVRGTIEEALRCFSARREEGYVRQIDEYHFRLVLDEALDNAMHHGNGRDPGKNIHLGLAFSDGCVDITVRDEGRGFSPDAVANPRDCENLLKRRGRGIHLMKALGDVQWEENGSIIRIRLTC